MQSTAIEYASDSMDEFESSDEKQFKYKVTSPCLDNIMEFTLYSKDSCSDCTAALILLEDAKQLYLPQNTFQRKQRNFTKTQGEKVSYYIL